MTIFEVSIGAKLEVEIANQYSSRPGQTYISQLLDIVDEKKIIIAAPIFKSRLVYVPVGTKIRIILFHGKHGLMSLPLTISFIDKSSDIIAFHATIEGDFEKIQRRQFYRLECFLNVLYRQLSETEIEKGTHAKAAESTPKNAILKNISGCGACVITEEEIPKSACLELLIDLNGKSPIKVLCRVVRSVKIEAAKLQKYELGLYFDKIDPKDQDIIIKYIFDQQRLLLKNNIID